MNNMIKFNVDDELYMKYWNNATDMWLSDGWAPMEHQDYTEVAYDIIIQKQVCEQLMEASSKAGDEMTYEKTLKVRDALEDIEAKFIHVLSMRNRAAFLLLTVNLCDYRSGKCTALSMNNRIPKTN